VYTVHVTARWQTIHDAVGVCVCAGGGGDDLQRNLQKELESKLSKFRKATFKPSAANDAKLAVAD